MLDESCRLKALDWHELTSTGITCCLLQDERSNVPSEGSYRARAVEFISRQIVYVVVVPSLLLVTLGVLFVAIVFREPPRL